MLLKENTLAPNKATQYINIALGNSEKMIASLNGFLTLLKSEKGSIENSKNTTNKFNFFLKELISLYAPDFKIKNMNFYFKSNMVDALTIVYDFKSLKIIITNLISNAIKYSNANSSIYFTVNLTETALQITIKDFGFGIAEDDKEKVFSRFYQSKNNTNIGGFGIGLSLVSYLTKKLKGTIRLESELNVGSVFYIDLPYKTEKYSLYTTTKNLDFELLSLDDNIEKNAKSINNFPKALIVDDNLVMVMFLTKLFSSFLNCSCAFNGQEALVKVKEEYFDIIISDLRMPIMDGAQLKAALNKIDLYKDIPFIMITSVFYDKLKDLKNTLGLNEYIEKPFTKNEILSRVQFALERSVYRKKIFSTNNVSIDFEGSQTELIEKIKESILSNLTNADFNVKVLAQMCGYEQKKLNTVLKSKLGLSIVNIILEVRMLKAYELIVKNIHPTLNEIIYAVGLNSRSYFNRKFEKRFGIKAGELKKKNLK
jgi:CheY-like chemotaxis protein/AraC-like DNA-binding protein